MLLHELEKKNLIGPPKWLVDNTLYLTKMGSIAYGVSNDDSDTDLYGFCVPPKSILFPHLDGYIEGFGKQKQKFEQWQEHHVFDEENDKEYDFQVFNIVKYFQLCMDNNPNMIDSLFTPIGCVVHCPRVGLLVRENRRLFLHKGAYHKFLGYAHSQLHKMSTKNPEKDSKRYESIQKFGFDIKYAYHLVRLSDECEQILSLGDIDLQRSKEHMKAVRNGEIPENEIREWFSERERTLEKLYADSKLQHSPDEDKIKGLLLKCLEDHYGSLDKCLVVADAAVNALREIQEVLNRTLH